MGWRQVLDHCRPLKEGDDPGRILMSQDDFIQLVRSIAGVKLDRRGLRGYASRRLELLEPPVRVRGKTCYVFPHDFDRLGVILILRQHYHLSLDAIRSLLARYPRKNYNLIINRRLAIEDMLELAQMIGEGYGVGHMAMSKASDALLLDLAVPEVSTTDDLQGALKTQGKLLIDRLDEMKRWVASGGWQRYVERQADQDAKHLHARRKALRKARAR
jgi:DNA-binding transcriptional MerR regulator